MNWLKRLFKQKPDVQAKVTIPKLAELNLEEWQKSLDVITEFRRLYSTSEFQDMLRVLHTQRPRGARLDGLTAEYQLGFIAGYEQCLTSIYKLTQYPQRHDVELEADFGADKILDKQ